VPELAEPFRDRRLELEARMIAAEVDAHGRDDAAPAGR